jgi:hypothetical protein
MSLGRSFAARLAVARYRADLFWVVGFKDEIQLVFSGVNASTATNARPRGHYLGWLCTGLSGMGDRRAFRIGDPGKVLILLPFPQLSFALRASQTQSMLVRQ